MTINITNENEKEYVTDFGRAMIAQINAKDYYVTQYGRAVVIKDRQTDANLQTIVPPADWNSWGWNFAADGKSIILTTM